MFDLRESEEIRDEEDDSSRRADSTAQTSVTNDDVAAKNTEPELVSTETRQVFWSRTAFLFVLCVAAGATAAAVFLLSRQDERKSFEVRFDDFAHQIIEVSQINARAIFGVFESMSLHMTTYTEDTNDVWPFVTIPGFEAQGQQAMESTGATTVGVTPIVTDDQKDEYERYQFEHQDWIQESLDYAGSNVTWDFIPRIFGFDGNLTFPQGQEIYAPVSVVAPIEELGWIVNFDSIALPYFGRVYDAVFKSRTAVLSEVVNLGQQSEDVTDWPRSFMAAPIFDTMKKPDPKLVAVITAQMPWHSYFQNLIPEGIDGIFMVVRNTCDQTFTFLIEGPKVDYIGPGELHQTDLERLEVSVDFTSFRSLEECVFSFHLYPSRQFEEAYKTSQPVINAIVVVCVFFLAAIFFIIYDQLVERRQMKVLDSATKSSAIVNSLFPENVRDRIMHNSNGPDQHKPGKRLDAFRMTSHNKTTGGGNDGNDSPFQSSPIADHFPATSVLFADIVGFTAWSSTRDPVEVFTLLETIYNAFDKVAIRLGVFKVETIGDCYVAACGLPEPRDDHAVRIFRFARQCLAKTNDLVHKLADTLGPDTSDLSMRFGIHSGPVTAGVLRGEKSRFQLFGDTVNTAARIETLGSPNRIHLSEQHSIELARHGKSHWFRPREESIQAKGKGSLKTFWGVVKGEASTASPAFGRDSDSVYDVSEPVCMDKSKILQAELENHIKWTVKAFEQSLKKLVATRADDSGSTAQVEGATRDPGSIRNSGAETLLDEVKDVISFKYNQVPFLQDPKTVNLHPDIKQELEQFVRTIAGMYRDVSYHSFAHASHVVQAMSTQFARIVEPQWKAGGLSMTAAHAITSEPMIQFACVFAALIHDADHMGLSNSVLIKRGHEIAKIYGNKSVAECHSIDVSWNLLMEPAYAKLRACIYSTQEELDRFRQLVVQVVLATDIMERQASKQRLSRWHTAFSSAAGEGNTSIKTRMNLRSTVTLEFLMQSADVIHTMQHWQTYIKWNERLFQETYGAFQQGDVDADPCRGWYDGELSFFDNFVIPLAERLVKSKVLGESAEEYLDYAHANRAGWASQGRAILQGYLMTYMANKSTSHN